jgi:hypothetical protein
MSQTILIKRSNTTATPASLLEGELAYSALSKNLFIGTNGGANVEVIGGLGQASTTIPVMNGTAAVGTATTWARADHVHASDTSKASLNSNLFSGKQILMTPTASSASLLLPNGTVDPIAPFSGDLWANNGVLKWYNGTATKQIAFLDSNITGNAVNVTGIVAVANGGTGTTTSTGTGSVVLSNSPTLVTPNIGVATGTSFNSITGLAIAAPLMDSIAAVGVSTKAAREDHVHASDTTKVSISLLGANNGVATLDSSGKLTVSQIPDSLVGGLSYQGVWNASTNTPTLTNGTGTKGYYYKVSVAGNTTIDSNNNWSLGDLIVFDGTAWDKVEGGSPDVVSVAGKVGAVTLVADDVGLGNVLNVAQLPATQTLAVTGDVTATATALNTGTIALTLANSGVTAGTYNNVATEVRPFTVDAKGRITSIGAAVALAPTWVSITSKPTTIAGYGITDAISISSTIDGGSF